MRHCTVALASLVVAATGLGTAPAIAQESYPHGYIRQVEPGVTLQRATEASAEEAIANLPFLPGDRVWTDAAGRVEFQFPEGTLVRLDSASKLDYSAHDESEVERLVLRLWSGSLILRTRSAQAGIFEIETPGGLVEVAVPGVVRIDVEGGETELSVYEGEASLDTGRDRVVLAGGERTWARWGDGPATPESFDRAATDDFALWDADLESREAMAASSQRYLPEQLASYAPEFENHGNWVYEQPVGYVWQPRVAVGWSPYSNGRWTWTHYGWTWVPYEPWGWVPHHYGRWGFSVSLGWYWSPGTVWGSAWVSWGVGGGYVGWCPLGRYNRPVVPWHHRGYRRGHAVPRSSIGHGGSRGHAVPRGSIGPHRAWNVVRRGDMGRGNLANRRVDPLRVEGMHVAESGHERPNRGAGALTRTAGLTGAERARPRPGAAARGSARAGTAPMGSAGRGGAAARSVPRNAGATTALTGSAARARSRTTATGPAGSAAASLGRSGGARSRSGATARPASPTSRGTGSSWIGSAGRSRGTATSPSTTRPRNPVGALFGPREGSSGRGVSRRPTGSTPRGGSRSGTSSRSPGAGSRNGVSTRPTGSGARRGLSSQPRPSAPRSGVSSRPSSSGSRPRSGVSSQPRSAPRSGVSSRPSSSGSRPRSGVSSRPRSAPRSGVSSRPSSSGSRPRSGVSSRPRSAPRSGVSSRPSSSGSRPRSGVSSRPRSAPRSGVSSRSRSSAPRSSTSRSAPSRSGSGSRSSGSRSSVGSRSRPRRK